MAERGTAHKQEAIKPRPNPVEFTDVNSGERNSVLTPSGMAQLIVHRLKFDLAEADQGIYTIAADSAETKVAIVGGNKPAELMFLIPDTLTAGDYTLVVRATIHDSADVRQGNLDAVLTVS